jgi:UDP-N-acetylglucosamine 4,6-dehydratase
MLRGRILLTGGAGFLSRGIMRRADAENWPCEFTVYSRDELKQAECRRKYPRATYVLGDIRDTERLSLVALGHTTIIHTAALKYVPEAESNVGECISINVGGTSSVIQAARSAASVEHLVAISTDKAVEPLNTYGTTKLLMERLVGEAARWNGDGGRLVMSCVRYGNVVGSTGSALSVFQRQLDSVGALTLTDPNMTRFFMGINDAVDTILFAVEYPDPGSVLIRQAGALSLLELVRYTFGDVPTETMGLRAGEKTYEKLLCEQESMWASMDGNDLYYAIPPVYQRTGSGFSWQKPFELRSDTAPRVSERHFSSMLSDAEAV